MNTKITGNNSLFYIHSDHPSTALRTSLGSATFLTHGNGQGSEGLKVANSTQFFTPFGRYRIQPTCIPIITHCQLGHFAPGTK